MIIVKKVTGVKVASNYHVTSYFFWHENKPILAPTLFLLHESMNGISFNTIRSYKDRIKTFFNTLSEWKTIESWKELKDRDMHAYINSFLIQKKGLKRNSVKNHIAALHKFYQFAMKMALIEKSPNFDIELANYDFKEKTLLSDEIAVLHSQYIEEEDFINILLPEFENLSGCDFTKKRAEIVILLGYYLGLRAGEVTDHRNFDTRKLKTKIQPATKIPIAIEIEIIGKGDKLRTVPVSPFLVSKISDFLYGARNKVKDGPLISKKNGDKLSSTSQLPSDIFSFCRKSVLSKSNLGSARWGNCRFHTLRKCYATNLVAWCIEKGLDPWIIVPEYMGHKRKETTFIYVFFDAIVNKRSKTLKNLAGDYSKYQNWLANNFNKYGVNIEIKINSNRGI